MSISFNTYPLQYYETMVQTLIDEQSLALHQLQVEQNKARTMQNLLEIIVLVDLDPSTITCSNILRDSINKVKEWQHFFAINQNNLMTHEQRHDVQMKLFIAIECINLQNNERLHHISSLFATMICIMEAIAHNNPMGNLQYTT